MAIVTISQIKHRRGIKGTDPMPQLASAELGWAVDEQGLYIGNGTIAEGAPAVGNTEILTEHSNLTALLSDYTYEGPFLNALNIDTDSGGGPIIRPNDERLDDNTSVRSYGATGDALVPDVIAALNQAIGDHAGNAAATNRYWTTIYVPAGTYNIVGPLQLPSRVRLVGDGYNSTIINRTDTGTVLEIRDSAPGTFPSDIYISGIGFTTADANSDIATIIGASDITFDRCSFNGLDPDTTALSNEKACVIFSEGGQPADNPTFNIKFVRCFFTGNTYGIASGIESDSDVRQDISNIVVENCLFDDLYKSIVVGKNADTGETLPSDWRVTLSVFDTITKHGIHCFRAKQVTTGLNHFADVGNDQLGAGNAATEIIIFGDTDAGDSNPLSTPLDLTTYENCYSIGDTFDRDDADDLLFKRVTTNALNSYSITPFEIFFGSLHIEPGRVIRLADNTAAATGIVLPAAKYNGAVIDYQVTRGNAQRRIGTLTITIEATGGSDEVDLMDDFMELANDVGLSFNATHDGTDVSVNYALDNTSTTDGAFTYSIRHLTNVLAIPVV